MFGYVKAKDYKALQYDNDVLTDKLEDALDSRDAWKRAAEGAQEDLRVWRERFELSQNSPEIKADTEAAFARGAQFAKEQVLKNIYFLGQSLQIELPASEKTTTDANV